MVVSESTFPVEFSFLYTTHSSSTYIQTIQDQLGR
jgi:hypothetical protein